MDDENRADLLPKWQRWSTVRWVPIAFLLLHLAFLLWWGISCVVGISPTDEVRREGDSLVWVHDETFGWRWTYYYPAGQYLWRAREKRQMHISYEMPPEDFYDVWHKWFRKREAKFVKTGKEPEEIQIAETVWGLTWTYHVGSRWSDVFRVEVVPTSGGCKAMYSVYRMTGE